MPFLFSLLGTVILVLRRGAAASALSNGTLLLSMHVDCIDLRMCMDAARIQLSFTILVSLGFYCVSLPRFLLCLYGA